MVFNLKTEKNIIEILTKNISFICLSRKNDIKLEKNKPFNFMLKGCYCLNKMLITREILSEKRILKQYSHLIRTFSLFGIWSF